MATPIQNEIVVAAEGEEFEVEISVADDTITVGRFIETVAGVIPRCLLVDGFPVPPDRPMGEVAMVRGSRLELLTEAREEPVGLLVGLSGSAAGEVIYLPPGVHRVGCIDVGVQGRGIQGGAACLYVDVDGATRIDPGASRVMIEREPAGAISVLTPGDLVQIDGQNYRFTLAPPHGEATGRAAFNRPPRSEFPASLPLLVAPSAPPAAQQPIRFGWGALVIPVLIGGLMALVWNPMMAMFAIFSPAMMLANWYEEKRRTGRANEEADSEVATAMAGFRERLGALRHAAHSMAWRGSPGPARLVERIVRGDSRLWQRRHDHPDFLELAIGVGTLPWAPDVTPPEPDRAAAANQLLAASAELHDVPVTVELGDGGVVGLVGHRRRQIEMVRWLVAQAATHHGPSDLAMLIVTDHAVEWDWAKWLPHLQIDGDGRRLAIARPGEEADALLMPLLDSGDDAAAPPVRSGKVGPATLLLVDIEDVTTAAASSVRRALSGEGRWRRCGIALGRTVEELPSSCSDIVTLDETGVVVLDRPSRAQHVDTIRGWRLAASAARRLARRIGGYADPELSTTGGNLPDLVHLMDLIGLGRPTADAIMRRWAAAGPNPVPVAPIGTTAEGPLAVDWAGDGPHALLAGTTGAGKSELLRSLVASLAASVDPGHLNFVLIDYKGGSAFDACAGLPHTVGMVTDLDGHLAQRALTCLEAELRYREETLRVVGAGDIDEYQTHQRDEPLPRLLVVIDEFAALARELPDFMAALVDIAQRGRSLGVHLLLATQRPNGVINDNIRANTNLRISLRVQDVADSMDVLGTSEAAGLSRSRPGRGFLRRGPGDIVAFQSALVTGRSSGTGSAVLLAPFVLGGQLAATAAGDGPGGPSDLEELVVAVTEAATRSGMRQPRLPWPDPLPARLQMADLGTVTEKPNRATIGLLDEPHRQRRRPYCWATDSNLFIYGVQGSGTSSALIAAITAACRLESPSSLHAYLIDFDDQRLSVVETLPHVGAVIGAGERDRQTRLLRYLQREVAERRELAATSASTLEGKPRIIVGVDNFAGFRAAFDDPADMGIKESLGRIVADGPGVGVVVVATAKQPIDIPTQVASLVPAKLVMQLADRYEYTGLGVTAADPPEIPGRAFEAGTSLELQLAAVAEEDIAEVVGQMGGAASEQAPWAIELLPTEVKIPDIVAGAEVYDLEWRIPVAVGDDSLSPVAWTLRDGDHVLISGPARSGKSTTLTTIATVLRTARPDIHITALTPRRSPLADCAAIDLLVDDSEQLERVPAGAGSDQLQAILIDDAEDVDDAAGTLTALIADRHPNCHVFAAGAGDVLRSAYGHWTQAVRRSRLGLALNPNPTSDGDLWQTSLPRRGPAFFPAGRGYLVAEGSTELCQVAWQ